MAKVIDYYLFIDQLYIYVKKKTVFFFGVFVFVFTSGWLQTYYVAKDDMEPLIILYGLSMGTIGPQYYAYFVC